MEWNQVAQFVTPVPHMDNGQRVVSQGHLSQTGFSRIWMVFIFGFNRVASRRHSSTRHERYPMIDALSARRSAMDPHPISWMILDPVRYRSNEAVTVDVHASLLRDKATLCQSHGVAEDKDNALDVQPEARVYPEAEIASRVCHSINRGA